jgi:hypothetical protein
MTSCRHVQSLARLRDVLASCFGDDAREDEQPIDMAVRLLLEYRAAMTGGSVEATTQLKRAFDNINNGDH